MENILTKMFRSLKGGFDYTLIGGLVAVELLLVIGGIVVGVFIANQTAVGNITGIGALFLPYVPLAMYLMAFVVPFVTLYSLLRNRR